MQKGKFSAGAALCVSTLKNVDLPTFGTPTIPIRRLVPMRPINGFTSGTSAFLGGILEINSIIGIKKKYINTLNQKSIFFKNQKIEEFFVIISGTRHQFEQNYDKIEMNFLVIKTKKSIVIVDYK